MVSRGSEFTIRVSRTIDNATRSMRNKRRRRVRSINPHATGIRMPLIVACGVCARAGAFATTGATRSRAQKIRNRSSMSSLDPKSVGRNAESFYTGRGGPAVRPMWIRISALPRLEMMMPIRLSLPDFLRCGWCKTLIVLALMQTSLLSHYYGRIEPEIAMSRATEHWQRVDGEVLHVLEHFDHRWRKTTCYSLLYRYEVGGYRYQKYRMSLRDPCVDRETALRLAPGLRAGGKVTVYVDPLAPSQSVLLHSGMLAWWETSAYRSLGLVTALCVALNVGVLVIFLRRSSQRR